MELEPCIKMLKALADPTRWRIVGELLRAPLTVGEIGQRLVISQYNVSKHVRILREAGIATTHKLGKNVECDIAPSFRQRLDENEHVLDLGCCSFRFDQVPKTCC